MSVRGNQSELIVVRTGESSGSGGVAFVKGVGGREDLSAGFNGGAAEAKFPKEGGLLVFLNMV